MTNRFGIDQKGTENIMDIELGEVQAKFADIIWEREPIASGELTKICEKELGWKKSTTYTVLKKLCEKGIFQNVNGTVISVISKDSFYFAKSEKFVNENYKGSIPTFLAAFTSRRKLSKKDIDEIKKEYVKGIKFHFVDHIREVLDIALI